MFSRSPDEGLTFSVVGPDSDRSAILELRRRVYVDEASRVADVGDFAESFDRYDQAALYLLATAEAVSPGTVPAGAVPVGTVKVIPDSPVGLPCDEFADLAPIRAAGGRPVEFGHLIAVPEMRKRGIGLALMKRALDVCVRQLGSTHIVADIFIDKDDHSTFYRSLGFETLFGPYKDPRFLNAPDSLLLVLPIASLPARRDASRGRARELLSYFLEGVEPLVSRSVAAPAPAAPVSKTHVSKAHAPEVTS